MKPNSMNGMQIDKKAVKVFVPRSIRFKKTKWLATFLFILSGAVISMNTEFSKYAFLTFFLAHCILSFVFYKTRETSLLIQNAFFIFIDIIGIYRWFF